MTDAKSGNLGKISPALCQANDSRRDALNASAPKQPTIERFMSHTR